MKHAHRSYLAIADDVIMILLSLVSGYILIRQFSDSLTPLQQELYYMADFVISIIFLSEFAIKLVIAPSRKHFLKWYWWELLSAIPLTNEIVQGMRLLRLMSVIRIMRIVGNLGVLRISEKDLYGLHHD